MSHHLAAELDACGSYIRTIRESIGQIEADRELIRNGYQLIFAVDFAEIRRFLDPRTDRNGACAVASLPGEPPESGHVRQQLALAFLFGQLGHDLLLLPPHQIEMSDHFHLRHSLYESPELPDHHRVDDSVARHLTEHDLFPAMAALLGKDPDGASLSPARMKRLARFVREKFKELAFLVGSNAAGRARADEPVRHILKRHRIRPYAEYFGDAELQFDAVLGASAPWLEHLADQAHAGQVGASYTDGLVCGYLERTNAVINPRKEVMLFITSSPSIAAVLQGKELIQAGPAASRTSVVRDLNYVSTLLWHRRSDPAEMDEELGRTKLHLDRLSRVLREASTAREVPIPPSFRRAAALTLAGVTREFTARENLGLAIGADGAVSGDGERRSVAGLSPHLSAELTTLFRLVTRNDSVRLRLREDHLRANSIIAEHVSDLDLLLNSGRRGARHVHQFHSHYEPAETKFILESLGSEMPAEVYLQNPQVHRIVSGLSSERGRQPLGRAWQNAVLGLAGARTGDPELHAMRAYLFMTVENWSSALAEVTLAMGNEAVGRSTMLELLHLKTVLHRIQEQTEEGILSCVKGLGMSGPDPRLNHELALLLWQVLRSQRPEERRRVSELVKKLIGEEPDYAMALDYARRALSALQDGPPDAVRAGRRALSAHVLNSVAQLALELFRVRRDVAYLKMAEEKMAELRAVLPEKKWMKKFFHTMGSILYQRWDLSRERIDELRAAKKYLKETTVGPSVPESEKTVYERDLEQISSLLLRLGYSDREEHLPVLRQNLA